MASPLTVEHSNRLRGGPKPDGIIVVGMGGSALAGDLLRHCAAALRLPVPIVVWKSYGLPSAVSATRPLYVFVSFSGNTEETLSGLQKLLAARNRPPIGVVTTGGTLLTIAEQEGLPLARFERGSLTPREGVGYTYHGLTELLRAVFPTMRRPTVGPAFPIKRFEPQGMTLAKALKSSTPIIYTDTAFQALGYLWKINLNETAKHLAFSSVLPEAAHNEVTSFETKPK
ncbi:MAG: SIS domain-containing protein, partial [Patescibacteria group bacterium]